LGFAVSPNAWTRLCDGDVEIAAHHVQLQWVDLSIDHPVAVGADALERAGGVTYRDAFGHLPSRYLRLAAGQAVNAAGTARPLRTRSALTKEAANFFATDHGRALTVDPLQAPLEPVAGRVLVDVEQARDLFHRIAAVDFRERGIGVAGPHRSARVRDRQRLQEPRVGV
jgi:hypothetical protein